MIESLNNPSVVKSSKFNTSTQKLAVLILILIIAPIMAAVYGAIHDQLSFTISPEYFTKFKFRHAQGNE